MTNFENIKSMSLEQMTIFLNSHHCQNCAFYDKTSVRRCTEPEKTCAEGIKKWLESEAAK